MKTVILSQRYSRDSRLVESAARQKGYKTFRIQGTQFPDHLRNADILVYTEGFMAEYVSQELDVVILRPEIDALTKVGPKILGRQVTFCQKSELKAFSKPTFIKPADQKFFQAGVYQSLNEIIGFDDCPPDDPIFISEVVNFVEEYRFFCLDGVVLTGSIYMQDGVFVGDDDVLKASAMPIWAFAESALASATEVLPPGVVVDVGVLEDGRYALIEFNPAWASGVYGCDPIRVLDSIEGGLLYASKVARAFGKIRDFLVYRRDAESTEN